MAEGVLVSNGRVHAAEESSVSVPVPRSTAPVPENVSVNCNASVNSANGPKAQSNCSTNTAGSGLLLPGQGTQKARASDNPLSFNNPMKLKLNNTQNITSLNETDGFIGMQDSMVLPSGQVLNMTNVQNQAEAGTNG